MTQTVVGKSVIKTTSKAEFRTLIVKAMNEIRAKGEEPTWQSVVRYIEKLEILKPGDFRENNHNPNGGNFDFVWQTTLSFVASDMKNEGLLVREPNYPWILTEWGITGVDLAKEIQKRKKIVNTCTSCWLQHRPEVECW